MPNKLPNFLIVGAAKCGTTSLHNYLMQHPQVFMSKVKEPKYFSSQVVEFPFKGLGDDLVESELYKNFSDYKVLFSDSKDEKIIGESSADNLYYSSQVIPLIKEKLGDDIKIIILLRNPIQRAYSAYMHLKRDLREEEENFQAALALEQERIANNYEFIWHYKKAGLYSQDIINYQKAFKNVKVILNDDLKKEPEQELEQICNFLEIDKDFEFNLEQNFNSSGAIKNKFLQKILASRSPSKRKLGKLIPSAIKDKLKSKNLKKVKLSDNDRKTLSLYYKDEIQKIEKLLNRDLSNWLN
ncbi:Sulfotransferase domain-containing protein [Mesonia phycicola]|uniref:Sulfotransferase domain-containing protein n=1 Tax=Mesonia phycicola TaxID=579105 RepID=A0A1M6D1X5_9FLAO|nr:sulfotransferase [Mesonia phycicola]SHI67074.1 Sulfotransferase domain-containing protein [Mesonia phycicola]